MLDLSFYKGKRVLITGHTGFKGAWMCQLLLMAGAEVIGYALEAPTEPNLFGLCRLSEQMTSIIGDIRDVEHLKETFCEQQPEIVIHMAAQTIVRESYKKPVYTYETNVLGTANVLECIRVTDSVRSFVNVTTDKVYLNKEWEWPYRENDELNGYDPYSNSKSCSELVTSSFLNSFLQDKDVAVSTVRAGNVIGGGDFAKDRIIPDCMRSVEKREDIIVRNPFSIRPYEYVLEPVTVYLMIAEKQYKEKAYAGNYNVGPNESDCWTTGDLVTLFCEKWKNKTGENVKWVNKYDGGPHEAGLLKLDCSKLKRTFEWEPKWNIEMTMEEIVQWFNIYLNGGNIINCTKRQIGEFLGTHFI